jgi:uncharacterized iron-regulated membrane protein
MKAPVLNRKLHRWGAVISALPLLVVVLTGLLLLLKKEVAWIQPPTRRGGSMAADRSLDSILEAARGAEEAGISSWKDVDRIDVRPAKGVAKVRAQSGWEVQVDLETGERLQVAYRRSDLIESLHDGSWFHEGAKLGIFLPSAVILLGLWISGIYLFLLPYLARRKRQK